MAHGLGRALRRPWRLSETRRWAADAFARRYAEAHALDYAERGETPGGTLWLAGIDAERSHSFMRGALGGGPDGVAFFAERLADPGRDIFQAWTVARYAIAPARELVEGIACVPRLTPAWGGRVVLASVLPEPLIPIRLGREPFDDRHETGIAGLADRPFLDALFDDAFATWLDALPFGRHGEQMLRLELRHDVLCVWLRDTQRTGAALDAFLRHCAHVARHVLTVCETAAERS